MEIPAWARERITREAKAYLSQPTARHNDLLDRVVRELVALPVYADMGGTLLVAADGEVYCLDHDSIEVRREHDPGWQLLARTAVAEIAPELRVLLPDRPPSAPDCAVCSGSGHIQATPTHRCWCGTCWGLGWRETKIEPNTASNSAV
ncbi:hypothetical protein VT84_05640 [Gemmata sp. SH-PL17]|nr:hypothetical protein VT84_05640 [Gemmata sp. SH-PL17]